MKKQKQKQDKIKVSDLQFDDHNLNKGTDEGNALLEHSITKLGTGRSILVDKNGKIIAGNKTAEAAMKAGITNATSKADILNLFSLTVGESTVCGMLTVKRIS